MQEQATSTSPEEKKKPRSVKKTQKGASAGRHKPQAGAKGLRQCDACNRKKEVSEFALNQTKCSSCKTKFSNLKASLDVIYKMAKRQGQTSWLEKVKAAPVKLRHVLDSYERSSAQLVNERYVSFLQRTCVDATSYRCKKEAQTLGRKKSSFSVLRCQEACDS
eukprot:6491484-Amphidinium_carterae.1